MAEPELDMKMKILLAAKKLFAKHGYDATSVRQICEEAGANVALVSYYFGGKESVFYEIFNQFFPKNKLIDFFAIEDPIVGIRTIIQGVIEIRSADPQMITLIQMEIITITPRVEKMRELVYPLWKKVRDLLEKGRQDGIFHFESLDSTLMFVLGSMFFYKQREFFELMFTEDRPDTQTLIAQTTTYVMNALGYQNKGD
ncbi:AcrR family transcriptional regulator [Paenibacillus sp. V4I3]|uniref:TetR/AcrR family transcriptional regulator n=1 Tax=unclassified Paenibacillus TaxID=185978 RepID=UPI00277F25F1|nr:MULTISPECIES: TetR/AcrR family transcriptional regulator [unclassified Paenibacillus]MDQ0871383.1 AcrR family transcriptional regulator [Paenibacillus sp. V4I3]MDQ0885301.1 AcrR family transcriptional regulator [Paenibacillus sp. V4I9]